MKTSDPTFVTIVSGLPRSGTSMMMQMLQAGGMCLLTDELRTADQDNLKGYFEFEPVKKTRRDASWVKDAVGRAVKVIYMLLPDLPADFQYRVLFMRREITEVITSQQKMLERRGEKGAAVSSDAMARVFLRQLSTTEAWLAEQTNFEVLDVEYRAVIKDPAAQVRHISQFLCRDLDVAEMSRVVEPTLYRQRATR